MPPISPLTPLTPRLPAAGEAAPQAYATLDSYPGAEGAQRRAPAVWAEGQFNWQPFDAPLYGKPGRYAGTLAVRSDFGFVQPSWHPTDRLEHETLPVEHFYHQPQTTLACTEGQPNPRESGAFGPQSSDVRMLTREWVQLRAHTLPSQPGQELGPVVLRSQSRNELARLRGASVLPPPPAQPCGTRPAGLTWPAHRLPADDADFLRSYARPSRTLAGRDATWRPPRALRPAPARLLDCAQRTEINASAQAAAHTAAVADAHIGRVDICNFAGVALPVTELAERYGRLQHLSLAHCPNLVSLADLASGLPGLRFLQLLGCPSLCTLGADLGAFTPTADGAPARIALTSVLLCPQLVGEHDLLVTATRDAAFKHSPLLPSPRPPLRP